MKEEMSGKAMEDIRTVNSQPAIPDMGHDFLVAHGRMHSEEWVEEESKRRMGAGGK